MKRRRPKKLNYTRGLRFESLENRRLLAADWGHNAAFPEDVDGDSIVAPMDALVVINALTATRSGTPGAGAGEATQTPRFLDVNDDARLTPSDALQVINLLSESRFDAGRQADTGDHAPTDNSSNENTTGSADDSKNDNGADHGDISSADDQHTNDPSQDNTEDSATDSKGDEANDKTDISSADDPHAGADDQHTNDPPQDNTEDSTTDSKGDEANDKTDDSSANETHADGGHDAEFQARLSGHGQVEGKAKYESKSEHGKVEREFGIKLSRAEPGTTYHVYVDSIFIGQFVADDSGHGKLELGHSDDADGQGLPTDFPDIQDGSKITVNDSIDGVFSADND